MMYRYGYGGAPGMGWGAGIGLLLLGLLALAGVIVLIAWAVRVAEHPHAPMQPFAHAGGHVAPGAHVPPVAGPTGAQAPPVGAQPPGPPPRDAALDVARERYARGEMTKEQFEEIKTTLGY
jgi:hypothetical protein